MSPQAKRNLRKVRGMYEACTEYSGTVRKVPSSRTSTNGTVHALCPDAQLLVYTPYTVRSTIQSSQPDARLGGDTTLG